MDGSPGGVRYRAPYGNHSDAYIRILSRGEQMPGADFWQNEINVTKKQPLKGFYLKVWTEESKREVCLLSWSNMLLKLSISLAVINKSTSTIFRNRIVDRIYMQMRYFMQCLNLVFVICQ